METTIMPSEEILANEEKGCTCVNLDHQHLKQLQLIIIVWHSAHCKALFQSTRKSIARFDYKETKEPDSKVKKRTYYW
jgi:hypothetical protein